MSRSNRSNYIEQTTEDLTKWPERLYNEYELINMGEGDRFPEDYELKEPKERQT